MVEQTDAIAIYGCTCCAPTALSVEAGVLRQAGEGSSGRLFIADAILRVLEGSRSQGVRPFGLRHARDHGLAKTRLQHIVLAVAINLMRVVWLTERPRATTRTSAFAQL